VDVSVWPRCDAEASPGRGYYCHPSRHSAGQPIVAGWACQFIAQLGFARESRTAPMDALRVHPEQEVNAAACSQVEGLLARSAAGDGARGAPLFVFDAGYDPVKLQRGLEGSACQILVRLRAGRCLHADPSLSEPPANTGGPRRHGPRMKRSEPETWPEPSIEHGCEDAGYGSVRVGAWAGMHPKVRAHGGRGGRGPLPIVAGTLVLVEVERLPRGERRREPKRLWLWWRGGGPRRISASSGAPTSGASTWSTPSASSSRRSDGTPPVCATPSKPACGHGSLWPPSPNSGSLEHMSPTGGCPGRGATNPVA
jgi:hypothetical protein